MIEVDWRNLPPVSEDEQPRIPDRPSQTFLKHHDVCDRAAMLYLRHRAGAGSHALNRGSAFHDIVAELTLLAMRNGENKVPVEVGKDRIRAYFDENPEVQMSAAERDSLRYMVANWCEGSYFPDPNAIVAVETTLTLEIGGYPVVCRIDRADRSPGTLTIIDYKTAWAMPDEDEFKGQGRDEFGDPRGFGGNFQTQMYALAAAFGVADDGLPIADGIDRFKLRLEFPRFLRPEGLAAREAEVTRQQLTDYRLDVEDQLRRLREVNDAQRKWQPTPGTHCRECPAEYECPLPRILRPESQHANLDSVEDLEKAGTAWLFMSKRASNLKARVKAAAKRLAEEDPEAMTLPGGDTGIYIGRDLALVFVHKDSEKIRDKALLRADIEAAVEYGEQFDWSQHFTYSQGTTFDKRRVEPRPTAPPVGAEETTE